MLRLHRVCAAAALLLAWSGGLPRAGGLPRRGSALPPGQEWVGLFEASGFRIVRGDCRDCAASRSALWYFREEWVAAPRPEAGGLPSLVWVAAPELIEHARLSEDGRALHVADRPPIPCTLVPKIPSNRSYYDRSTHEFFLKRSLRLRGTSGPPGKDSVVTTQLPPTENSPPRGGRIPDALPRGEGVGSVGGGPEQLRSVFKVRTIWPEDYRFRPGIPLEPLAAGESLADLVTAEQGGARGRFLVRLLWERSPGTSWAGRSALALLLSGGQGDDDESQGGHFGVVTGRLGAGGEWADWLVNNFYNLDEESEKGIVAARVPMDNYLMDLNSGQSYYRPAYMLAVLLRRDRAPRRVQDLMDRVYDRFYRHEFAYHHSKANCTGISMDALAEAGWRVPRMGPTGRLKAAAAFLYLSIKDRSLSSGRKMWDYLTEERTRLLPRAGFEAAGGDLLRLLSGTPGRRPAPFEEQLIEDAEAVVFVRIPQLPSSRAFGAYPVGSFDEYRARVPADRSKWKTVSVDPRPFPRFLLEPRPRPR